MVYDPQTAKTYLDVNKSVYISNDRSSPEPMPPIPSFLTQVDESTINKVVNTFVHVDDTTLASERSPKGVDSSATPGSHRSRKGFESHDMQSGFNSSGAHPERLFKNENNLLPVERLCNGGLGIPLTMLGLVIKKLHNQVYGTKNLATIGTQTLSHDKWLEQPQLQQKDSPRKVPRQVSLEAKKKNEYLLKSGYQTSRQVLQQRVKSFGNSMLSKTVNHTDRSLGNEYEQHKTVVPNK